MRIVVSALGGDLNASVDLRFGRAPYFIIVDTDTLSFDAIQNPHVNASGGAGIQAAQMIANHGVEAVISGILGPNAFQTLKAIGIPTYQATGGSVREVVQMFKAGHLSQVSQPGPSHVGIGFGGMATGRRGGRGMGMGSGRRMGMGRGQNFPPTSPLTTDNTENNELNQLKTMANDLSQQLQHITERIRQLEQSQQNSKKERDKK